MASEKRLIDANALGVGKAKREVFDKPEYADGWNSAIEIIENAPSVDAVEVVRCKDCKYWHEETGWCDQHSWFIEEDGEPCHPWESNNWKMLNEDDFCSYGERKDNE